MQDKTRLVIYIKNKEILDILEQLPKGCKGLYIEQAILEFSKAKPRIEFHFEGITRPKRKRKTKEQIQSLLEISPKERKSPILHSQMQTGKMMFDFGKIN